MSFGDMNELLYPKKDKSRDIKGWNLPQNIFQYLESLKPKDA